MKIPLGPKPKPKPREPRPQPPPPQPGLFEQLLPCTWRGKPFPVSSIKVSFSHDLAEHKYWGVDAADVEATGRAPMQIEAEIPFVNGIVPGKGERWGLLYPTGFRELMLAFADRSSGELQHPELGYMICKPVSFDFAHDAQVRDGVHATARWVETASDQENDLAPGHNVSPVQVADMAALDLDASKTDLLALVPKAPVFEETFDTLVGKVTGVLDNLSLTVGLLANKPAQLLARVERLEDSVLRFGGALGWPVVDACERMKNSAIDMEAVANGAADAVSPTHTVVGTGPRPGRKISRFTVPAKMTLSGLLQVLPAPNSMDDLVGLNPWLVSQVEVAANSVVRYFG